jgi:hypothetical protein
MFMEDEMDMGDDYQIGYVGTKSCQALLLWSTGGLEKRDHLKSFIKILLSISGNYLGIVSL